ncbi:LamG-like jellyroll fold domain-containing protein [Mariniflexile sp. HNIBRBA6329]|uniref:LamG-like jellyroll fold domain-containing protein n=1 Tax=Mariniflexile sp. HNIBRBA6329 TaxID=3373088 RepID=UPI003746CB3C
MFTNTTCNRLPFCLFISIFSLFFTILQAQTLAFPEATGFGRYTTGARGHANPQIYLVTNLNDSGPGSFRDAVSQEGRFVIFKVGGIINLQTQIVVAKNTTIAGQTATGEGIVLAGPRVTFTGASNTIARYVRIRYVGGAKNQDASGLSNGANMIFDHMTFTWGTDEVFSINWDGKGSSPDNITIQNSIIGQGLHRHNHSAGGLMQPSDGKISIIGNLYISNKTRNPKVKGINEFVNNVVYNWGNYGNTYGHAESGDAYIMGGDSAGVSEVNIINNYFMGGPYTSSSVSTPFNRGNSNFYLYGSGNYFDNNKNGVLDGALVSEDLTGYPTGDALSLQQTPYDYPEKNNSITAQQAFDKAILNVGASYPRRDQVDSLMIDDLASKGLRGSYVYREYDLPFINGGLGHVYGAPAPLDTDNDGMPDAWEDANGLNKNNAADALTVSTTNAPYLNIEVYINGLVNTTPPDFIIPPSNVNFTNAASVEVPPSSSLTVNWNDNSDNEDNFILERSIDGTSFTVLANLAAGITSYNDTGLTPNTKYYYRVKATNVSESSVYSAIASLTTPAIPSAPDKTTNPTPKMGYNFVELSGGNLILTWNGSSNTENYAVYFGEDASNLTKLADVAYSASPSYQVLGLNSATNYYWRIDASNNKGSATGDVWTFRTISNVPEGIVGHWPFVEAPFDGGQITDNTSFANHGVLDTNYDNESVRVAGKANNALDFSTSPNGTYMVNIPNQDQLFLDKSSFTISFWMKAAANLLPIDAVSSYLLCKGSFTANQTTGATGKRFNVEFKSGQMRFAIDDNVTKKELSTSGTPFFTGNWEHVVVMRDVSAHKLKLYLNGNFVVDLDETGVNGIAEVSDLILGNIGELELLNGTGPAPYKGLLDELKIFNYPLNATEVLNLYQNVLLSNDKFSQNKDDVMVYPNPVNEQINISVPSYKQAYLLATITDMTGKLIFKDQLTSLGNSRFVLSIANKKLSGVYILNVSGENINSNLKIVVK